VAALRALWQALVAVGRRTEAISTLQAAVDVLPQDPRSVVCPLAWLLATTPERTSEELARAVRWAEDCCDAPNAHARDYDTLAAAYAATGDFPKAVEAARRAIAIADARGYTVLRSQIEGRLRLYEAGRPFIEAPVEGP
jgi:predicted Zn-dependent protease